VWCFVLFHFGLFRFWCREIKSMASYISKLYTIKLHPPNPSPSGELDLFVWLVYLFHWNAWRFFFFFFLENWENVFRWYDLNFVIRHIWNLCVESRGSSKLQTVIVTGGVIHKCSLVLPGVITLSAHWCRLGHVPHSHQRTIHISSVHCRWAAALSPFCNANWRWSSMKLFH
jgi:hypothetical protein